MVFCNQSIKPRYNHILITAPPFWKLLMGNCSAYLKEKRQRFRNGAGRIICGANYEINSADVLQSLGWQTLEERRKRKYVTSRY